ncbi:hypothetical protein KP003_14425 [Geomonas nitrogeniifigens]|uniref:hypothetical protein n=1 Tax=Geomonas diazotrophica TaxID=2843197 RepID=UPI001C2BF502|nr:hypothetical protein [Geomonas nitrogeniifigens]QXE85573.1 hypothetical protein KP003_14425 [Geomonas nitrogeniifigens]
MKRVLICSGVGKSMIRFKTGELVWAVDYIEEQDLREQGFILMETLTPLLGTGMIVAPVIPCSHCQHYFKAIEVCALFDPDNEDNDKGRPNCIPVNVDATCSSVIAAFMAAEPATRELIYRLNFVENREVLETN